MEDAVNSIVIPERGIHQVARDVKDDQPLQISKFDCLFHIIDEIVAHVELHEALQVL